VGKDAPSEWLSQLRRGVLELCVLRFLEQKPGYGYEIVSAFDAHGPLATSENTIYPLLRRLKADKLLETYTEESPSGPPRQYYRLTAQGRRHLAALENEWGEMVRAVDRFPSKGRA
jgi:PadR family transcriptional regulator PadR